MILYYFPPVASGGTYRPLKFIRYLKEFGWNSVIIAPTECRYESQDFELLKEIPHSTEIIRVKPGVESTWQYSIMRKLKLAQYYDDELIPDRHVGFVSNAIDAAKKRIKLGGIDLVFTSAPPYSIHLSGREITKETNMKWVCDFRDPWIACPFYNPSSVSHDKQNREIEKTYFENASSVIAFPEIRAQRERDRYPEFSHKIISIDNGFDPSDFPDQITEPDKNKITISHVGAITKDRPVTAFLESLQTVLDSDKNLKDKTSVEFYGDSRSPTPEDISRLSLSDITNFKGYVSHKNACKAMTCSNLLFMALPDYKGADGIMPLRLFEYVFSQRPVFLISPEGEASRFLEETNSGVWANVSNTDEIAEKLSEMLNQIASGNYKHDPDLSVLKKFERRNLTEKLANLFNNLLDGESG